MSAPVFSARLLVPVVAFTCLFAFGFVLPSTEDTLLLSLVGIPFLAVGALVVHNRPDNPVGWLFLGFAGVAAVGAAGFPYWASGPSGPGSRPGAALAASLAVHLWHPGFALFILGFLLFPEGRFLSRRWRIAAGITAALGIIGVLSGMLEHAFYADFFTEGVVPAPLLTGPVADVAGAIFASCVISLVGMLGVSAVCIFLRFWRSTGILRQQMKWVVSAVVLFAVGLPASLILLDAAYGIVFLPLIPISAGIAILKYRLFDIDVIINRALVYGALTALLALVYVVGVVGVGDLVRKITGEESNNFMVAASTLAVAGLFRPARSRVQSFIDRRFYHRKYDAARTVEAFSARLRTQVDLEALTNELVGAVHYTMQPTQVSVWLRS